MGCCSARFFAEVMFPYSYDSASYISAARNLLEGKGLLAPTLPMATRTCRQSTFGRRAFPF
jgi:hypothetical protein